MKSKVVAILETRTGAHLVDLVSRRGGIPLWAPALAEVPDLDVPALAALLDRWHQRPFNICVFQTGVGTKALFAATDAMGRTESFRRLLEACTVLIRGPKPVGELH